MTTVFNVSTLIDDNRYFGLFVGGVLTCVVQGDQFLSPVDARESYIKHTGFDRANVSCVCLGFNVLRINRFEYSEDVVDKLVAEIKGGSHFDPADPFSVNDVIISLQCTPVIAKNSIIEALRRSGGVVD